MTLDTGLSHGQVINNEHLCAVFKCSTQGGMRRSLTTNSLVLVSNHVASIYDDRWIGDTFHYTGMGQPHFRMTDSMALGSFYVSTL